jgi:hypothetical protein
MIALTTVRVTTADIFDADYKWTQQGSKVMYWEWYNTTKFRKWNNGGTSYTDVDCSDVIPKPMATFSHWHAIPLNELYWRPNGSSTNTPQGWSVSGMYGIIDNIIMDANEIVEMKDYSDVGTSAYIRGYVLNIR